jgi:hypothetical protein
MRLGSSHPVRREPLQPVEMRFRSAQPRRAVLLENSQEFGKQATARG